MIFDAMAHLDDPRVHDVDAILRRAASAGVTDIINAGVDETAGRKLPNVSAASVRVHRAVGLHPMHINPKRVEEQLQAVNDAVVGAIAVGEIGLDRRDEAPPIQLQEHVFARQIEWARQHERPVIIHCVRAWDRLLKLIGGKPLPGIVHGFGGPVELLERLDRVELLPSFGGAVSYPGRHRAREAASAATRFCLESDTPDHPPMNAHASEPAAIVWTTRVMAQLRQEPIDRVLSASTACARQIFGLEKFSL